MLWTQESTWRRRRSANTPDALTVSIKRSTTPHSSEIPAWVRAEQVWARVTHPSVAGRR